VIRVALKDFIEDRKCSPVVKVTQRQLFLQYQARAIDGNLPHISDTGYRVFSQFEEDGILVYLFAILGEGTRTFIDIGSADGINSNCANLAINFGWHGLFIDGNTVSIERGKKYYATHPDTSLFPPKFSCSMVNRENINQIIQEAGFSGDIDLLSIDIDGNDYWVWDALEVVIPRVVIIETHIEFGLHNIIVPYDPDYVYPGRHPDYHGASPVAMVKLAEKKGYRLVGANRYGFNTLYIKNNKGQDLIPTVTVEEILRHPRNKERFKLFEPIENWEYLQG
jgi:hypothetical protein